MSERGAHRATALLLFLMGAVAATLWSGCGTDNPDDVRLATAVDLVNEKVVVVRRSALCRQPTGCEGRRYPSTDARALGPHRTQGFGLRFEPHGGIFLSLHQARGRNLGPAIWEDGGQVADGEPLEQYAVTYPESVGSANTLVVRLSRVPGGPLRGFELRVR